MLIDTHCHLDFSDFDRDREEVIRRALASGVGRFISIGTSVDSSARAAELTRTHGEIFSSVGIHPHDAASADPAAIEFLSDLAKRQKKVVAIGEVGLDYYKDRGHPRDRQRSVFERFIRLAQELDLPLIIHSRDAMNETIDILKKTASGQVKGVMHCFSGDSASMKACISLGLSISFTGTVTFPNADNLRRLAREVPDDRLLIETDAPYLAPQAFRGKRNEPSYLIYLVRELARIREVSEDDIGRLTTHNANRLFRLGIPEPPAIAYAIRDSLYLNITNRCTCQCGFCTKESSDFVKGHNLKLEREPSTDEIIRCLTDIRHYREVAFCGFGEPTIRLDCLTAVARELKKKDTKVRLVTNGHGDLINKRPIAAELKGLVDRISVSLNADSESSYARVCAPAFGPHTFEAVLTFIKRCVAEGIETEVTCVDIDGIDLVRCEALARNLGASFRKRHHNVVG